MRFIITYTEVMAIFQNTPEEWQRLDYKIFLNGWTSLYWQHAILNNDIRWFKAESYKIIEFDCSKWSDLNQLHDDLKDSLRFPDYYGKNFNALNDCLYDIEITETGLLIVFLHFDCLEKVIAHNLLSIFTDSSRQHILFGQRLLTLVQVDDPNYKIEGIGTCAVSWNDAEWLNSKRNL
jgi:RNAse (barnase) inhibitor barstar